MKKKNYLIILGLHTNVGVLLLCHGLLSIAAAAHSGGHVLHLSSHQMHVIRTRLARVHIWTAGAVTAAGTDVVHRGVTRLVHVAAHYKAPQKYIDTLGREKRKFPPSVAHSSISKEKPFSSSSLSHTGGGRLLLIVSLPPLAYP